MSRETLSNNVQLSIEKFLNFRLSFNPIPRRACTSIYSLFIRFIMILCFSYRLWSSFDGFKITWAIDRRTKGEKSGTLLAFDIGMSLTISGLEGDWNGPSFIKIVLALPYKIFLLVLFSPDRTLKWSTATKESFIVSRIFENENCHREGSSRAFDIGYCFPESIKKLLLERTE